MTELYKAGRIKAIGVCNFLPHHLKALMETEVQPMVNQIEFHPGQMQEETVSYCKDHNIIVEAWSPLGTGRMLSNEMLKSIAAKYGKSAAQLCICLLYTSQEKLRWCWITIRNQIFAGLDQVVQLCMMKMENVLLIVRNLLQSIQRCRI